MKVENTSVHSGAVVPMVAVLSNPKSTTNASGMEPVRAIIRESANIVHFELDSIAGIDEALDLFARANPSLLVINGGDGTIGAVLGALLYRNPFAVIPPIAILPGGKTNMTAADLGMKGKPQLILRRLMELARRGEIQDRLVSRNLIELELGDGSEPRVGTFFGAAGVVKAIYWCRENAYARGLPNWLAHAWTFFTISMALMGLGKRRDLLVSDHMEIRVKGQDTHSGRYAIAIVSTLDKLLMGFRPFARAGRGGLKFSVIEPGRRTMFKALRGIMNGKFAGGEVQGVEVGRSDVIEILSRDPVTLDGEIYVPREGQQFKLRGNKFLTFIQL